MKLSEFLGKKGKHVWYVALTNEIVINSISGEVNSEQTLFIELDDKELNCGPIVYLGTL